MTVGSKEFEEIMKQFEKTICTGIYGHRFDRVPNIGKPGWVPGEFYDDGYVNNIFRAYQSGYAHARCVYMEVIN